MPHTSVERLHANPFSTPLLLHAPIICDAVQPAYAGCGAPLPGYEIRSDVMTGCASSASSVCAAVRYQSAVVGAVLFDSSVPEK
jgi:hypothetical protein